jgi:hypothetical protein
MAETCRKAGLNLRPHAKSHKCAEITRRQMAAGALGNCCAKPGELLALFEGGVRRPAAQRPDRQPREDRRAGARGRGGRAHRRRGRAGRSRHGLCSRRRSGTARLFDVLVDLDVGLKRSGVATPARGCRTGGAGLRAGRAALSRRPGLSGPRPAYRRFRRAPHRQPGDGPAAGRDDRGASARPASRRRSSRAAARAATSSTARSSC